MSIMINIVIEEIFQYLKTKKEQMQKEILKTLFPGIEVKEQNSTTIK